jgi:AcrR family transcriptional regulator
MFDVSYERGAGNVTVADVVERSGVSRRTFYEQFTDREDCFLAAFEEAASCAAERVIPAFESRRSWRESVRAGLIELLSFFDEHPRSGRLLVVESLWGGPRVLERRSKVTASLIRVIDAGRRDARPGMQLALTAEGTVGGVLTVLHSRLTGGVVDPLVELANPLMSMIVLPYLGSAASLRELKRPVPRPTVELVRDNPRQLAADPFKEAGFRLTYRTICVLTAVADCPGASNRLIGETAGIADQGQISKLLARLQKIDLVSNTGSRAGKGMPNAWTITEKGRRVTDNVRRTAMTEGPR